MRHLKQNLNHQFICISIIICGVILIGLGLFLPKVLAPVYEKNIYQYLEQPLELIGDDVSINDINEEVAYLYITTDGEIITSSNLVNLIDLSPKQILKFITEKYGKFFHNGKIYYYNTTSNNYVTKISLTNNNYIVEIREDLLNSIFPILLAMILIVYGITLWWSRRLVRKIEHLKEKIDNLDNDEYIDKYTYTTEDEFQILSKAIDNMKETLKQQEEYKNQMYQNISHDFKTPLTVIKSYMEAVEDGVENIDAAKKVINEQVSKLETKVQSLLYLNKLNYIKDTKQYKNERIDIVPILNRVIQTFKIQTPNIKWEIHILDKSTIFNGTIDMWEAITENIIHNFIRYAEGVIKITIKNHRIIFYNDGPNIDESILNDIFTPYKKGIKGQFGLGLSIVKKTISLLGYEIHVKNEKKGVTFIIK